MITRQDNHTKPSFSLAEMCLKRCQIGRKLLTAPGYLNENEKGTYKKRIYLDINGMPVDKKELVKIYNVGPKKIFMAFDESEGDNEKFHAELLISSKRKKPRKK